MTRIEAMGACIDPVHTLADIGTDHGYLPQYLFKQGKISNAILTDVNEGPLENARRAFSESNAVTFRLGNGLTPIAKGEVDAAVIAGMGGGLIRDILTEGIEKAQSMQYLILQPMTEQGMLRQWLLDHNFFIDYDYYFHDGKKNYEIIKVLMAESESSIDVFKLPVDDLEFGYRIARTALKAYVNFLDARDQKYDAICKKTRLTAPDQMETALKKRERIAMIRRSL